MKDACESCGMRPELPEYADDDLAECDGCGKTICVNDCAFDSDIVNGNELYWCGDCSRTPTKETPDG